MRQWSRYDIGHISTTVTTRHRHDVRVVVPSSVCPMAYTYRSSRYSVVAWLMLLCCIGTLGNGAYTSTVATATLGLYTVTVYITQCSSTVTAVTHEASCMTVVIEALMHSLG